MATQIIAPASAVGIFSADQALADGQSMTFSILGQSAMTRVALEVKNSDGSYTPFREIIDAYQVTGPGTFRARIMAGTCGVSRD